MRVKNDSEEVMRMASNKIILLIGIGIGIIGAVAIIYFLKNKGISTTNQNLNQATNVKGINDLTDNTAYNNDENWLIERNDDGSIKGIKVKRDVKVNR